jgi:hypothetical protein
VRERRHTLQSKFRRAVCGTRPREAVGGVPEPLFNAIEDPPAGYVVER